MAGVRFTAWLSENERHTLRAWAREHGCSENYLVRVAVRALLLGEPIPGYLHPNDHNDSNGGNDDKRIVGSVG